MALNEITKGMSNAAEMINENFKNGSVIEEDLVGSVKYVLLGNGLAIVFGKATMQGNSSDSSIKNVKIPKKGTIVSVLTNFIRDDASWVTSTSNYTDDSFNIHLRYLKGGFGISAEVNYVAIMTGVSKKII